MKQYYFPPSGFGFWYQLGVFNRIHDNQDIILGSSSGSLICLISILKKKDRNFDTISDLSLKIIKEIDQYNLHLYVIKFIKAIFLIINQYDIYYVKERLSKIYVIISVIHFPLVTQQVINPKSLHELKEAISASCYIPILSRCNQIWYYSFNNMKCIDGVFSSAFNSKPTFKTINSLQYASVIPCSFTKARFMYTKGLLNLDDNPNNINLKLILNLIYNNICDILYTIKCICYTIFNKQS